MIFYQTCSDALLLHDNMKSSTLDKSISFSDSILFERISFNPSVRPPTSTKLETTPKLLISSWLGLDHQSDAAGDGMESRILSCISERIGDSCWTYRKLGTTRSLEDRCRGYVDHSKSGRNVSRLWPHLAWHHRRRDRASCAPKT